LTQQGIAVARSYARAAFEVARSKHDVKGWHEDLEILDGIFTDEDVATAFANPQLDDGKRIGIALALLPDDFNAERANFVKLVVLARRTDLFPEIVAEFEALVAEAEGRTELELVVARPIDDDARGRFEKLLSEKLGRTVTLEIRVDPALVGGAVIRQGDHVTDGSVRRRLTEMRQELLAS
jgi:F-type H+-transporting ATPase subunit delta